MTVGEPWTSLGLAPTSDVRTIKSAYAAFLKRIDVEADPLAFIALREKLNWALQLANRPSPVRPLPPATPGASAAASATTTGIGGQDLARLQDRLVAILEGRVAGDSANCLHVTAAALLDSPALANVEIYGRIERWLATAMAQSGEMADPIVDLAVYHFRWNEIAEAVRTPFAIRMVVQRQRDLSCIAALGDPLHPWHPAFVELSTPATTDIAPADQRRVGQKVRLLLDSLRTHNPAVVNALDAARVAAWDEILLARARLSQDMMDEIARIEARDGPPKKPFPWIVPIYLVGQILFLYLISR